MIRRAVLPVLLAFGFLVGACGNSSTPGSSYNPVGPDGYITIPLTAELMGDLRPMGTPEGGSRYDVSVASIFVATMSTNPPAPIEVSLALEADASRLIRCSPETTVCPGAIGPTLMNGDAQISWDIQPGNYYVFVRNLGTVSTFVRGRFVLKHKP